MEFFYAAINLLVIIVTAIGAGLGVWGVINLLEAYSQEKEGRFGEGEPVKAKLREMLLEV